MDFAQALKDLSDTQIILVQDNFNTDKPASFYEVSPVLGRVDWLSGATHRSTAIG